MKNRMKKKIALFISLVMVITLVVIPSDVKAATYDVSGTTDINMEDSDSYNIKSGGKITIGDEGNVTGDIVIEYGGTLTVNGKVTGKITIDNGGTLTVKAGGSVSSVILNSDTEYNKKVDNYGTINNIIAGNSYVNNYETGIINKIDMPSSGFTYLENKGTINGFSEKTLYTKLNNYVSGTIKGKVNIGTNSDISNSGKIESIEAINVRTFNNSGTIDALTLSGTGVENSGSIKSLTVNNSPVVNNARATIGTLNVTYSSVENNGTIETLSYNTSSGSCNLTLGGSSSTGTLNLPNVGEGFYVKITAAAGAAIDAAGIYANSLDMDSSGGITVNNSIELSGTSSIPSGLGISVGASTKITTGIAYSNMIVSCDEKKYLLPNKTLTDKTIANMYDFNVDATQIDISELKVGYGDTDIKESAKTLNISNTGLGDMKCKITSIPDFVELYNGEEVLSADSTLSISNDATKAITIKLKAGKPVAAYSDNIVFEKWTAFNTADVTDVKTGSVSIPVTAKVIKKEGEGTVSVSNIYYGGEISPVVVSATNGITSVTYKYKVKGADDSTYSETEPTAAGEYTIQATFAATAECNEVIATANFSILRKTGIATVTVANVYYGEGITPVVESTTNGIDSVTYKYKVKGEDDSTYTSTVPTAAGEYTVQATFAQTDEYNAVTATANFAILRKTGTATVTVVDVYYGNAPSPVVESETNGITSVTYKYKVKGAEDSTYTATVPTTAGEYTIRATFAATEEYNEVTATADFAILRKTGTASVTVADVYYGNTPSPVVSSETNGTTSVTYKYKVKGADDSTYTATVPTAAGEYTIQATFATTAEYNEVTATDDFAILRNAGTATVTVANIYYGETIVPVVESATNGITSVTYKYKVKGADDSTYTATVPTAAGEYTIQATFAQTDAYNEVTATANFAILRKTGTGTVTVADVKYGEDITPKVESATNGTTAVTYKYKVKGAVNSTYTTTVPTAVGEYTIQATFAQTAGYNAVTATAHFSIIRNAGTATVTVADVHYGEVIVPEITSTNGTENVTYKYKAKNAPDIAYTVTAPTAVGEYTIQATFAQTESYNSVTVTEDFKILKGIGKATVTVADVYYGNTPSPVVSSATNGTDSVTYKYKVKGKADSTYTETVPTAVGEYTIQATLAPTDNFAEVVATSNFKISYLPVPENAYIISGEQGKNDYYTSEVTITPAQGYLIANSLDGTYKESITISKSVDAFDVYLKNATTGEKTSGVNVKAIKIDTEAPIILNAVDGDMLYGNQVEIKVQDDNLTQVLVNDVEMKIKDGTAILELSSKNGEESYSISCSDAAGNVRNIKLVVAENWMKDKTIPSGLLVKLVKEYSYKLGDGNWQVKGDETSYSGNITFYVNKDGEYTFSKVD